MGLSGLYRGEEEDDAGGGGIYTTIDTYMHTYIHTYVHTHTHACLCICICKIGVYIYIYLFVYARTESFELLDSLSSIQILQTVAEERSASKSKILDVG